MVAKCEEHFIPNAELHLLYRRFVGLLYNFFYTFFFTCYQDMKSVNRCAIMSLWKQPTQISFLAPVSLFIRVNTLLHLYSVTQPASSLAE